MGSHTAAFFDPYTNRSDGYCGDIVNTEEQLYDWISAADKAHLQVFIHAIGDRAIRVILDIFERVIKENGVRPDRKFRIEHAQHISSCDIVRFGELGIQASVQPQHAADDGRWCESVIGRDRSMKGTYAFKSLLDSGATLAMGSDWFVVPPNPIAGIAAAVTRRTTALLDTPASRADVNRPLFVSSEAITKEQALTGYTAGAAMSVNEGHLKGMLKPGMLADLVVIDKNLCECNSAELENAKVLLTICNGEIVYDREAEIRAANGETEIDRINRAIGKGLPPLCPCCH